MAKKQTFKPEMNRN